MDLQTKESSVDADTQLEVYLSDDRVDVLLNCPDPLAHLEMYTTMILAEFDRLDLPNFPSSEALKKMLAQLAKPGEDLVDQILIQGTKPQLAIQGHLQWSRDYFASGWVVDDETDSIDFREKIENCSVRRNELLVRKAEPVEGVPGMDVFGNPVPVEKPESASLRCGKGIVEVTNSGTTNFFAEFDGRVHFKDNTVSVDEVFAIHGDVDLKSGNIRHTGSITVDGDIRNGATVEAEGDLLVKGMIEQSNIKCGGTLTVAGGIIGDLQHNLEVGGNVEAKYIREADLAAQGDVIVTREILHSNVRALGCVFVPTGRISGGTTTALKGIRVATAGAPGSTDTLLQAGIDYSMEIRIKLFLKKIEHLESLMQPIQAALNHTEQALEKGASTNQVVIEELSERRMLIGQAISVEYMQVEELTQDVEDEAVPLIVINKELWSGTTIRLGQSTSVVKRSINKPRLASLAETKVQIAPLGDSNMPPDDVCAPKAPEPTS